MILLIVLAIFCSSSAYAYEVRCVQQQLRLTAGTQEFTHQDLGTVKAVVAFWGGGVTINVKDDGARWGLGYGTGPTSEYSITTQNRHNISPSDAQYIPGDRLINIQTKATGALDGYAEIDAMLSNGVRLNVADPPATAVLVSLVMFSGADIKAACGVIALPTVQDNTVVVSGIPFRADQILFLNSEKIFNNALSSTPRCGVGFVDVRESIIHRSFYTRQVDAATTASLGDANISTVAFYQYMTSLFKPANYTVSAVSETGFTVKLNNDGNIACHSAYLALDFGSFGHAVNHFQVPLTASQFNETRLNFQPKGMFVMMTNMTNANYRAVASPEASTFGFGYYASGTLYSVNYVYDQIIPPTDTETSTNDKFMLNAANGVTHVQAVQPPGAVMTPTGFGLNFTDASSQGRQWFYAAFGETKPPTARRIMSNIMD